MQILNGRDKGKQGLINQIIEERNWVFVEGLNWRYTKFGEKDDFPGIVVKEEMPLLVSLLVFLFNCKIEVNFPTHSHHSFLGDDGCETSRSIGSSTNRI